MSARPCNPDDLFSEDDTIGLFDMVMEPNKNDIMSDMFDNIFDPDDFIPINGMIVHRDMVSNKRDKSSEIIDFSIFDLDNKMELINKFPDDPKQKIIQDFTCEKEDPFSKAFGGPSSACGIYCNNAFKLYEVIEKYYMCEIEWCNSICINLYKVVLKSEDDSAKNASLFKSIQNDWNWAIANPEMKKYYDKYIKIENFSTRINNLCNQISLLFKEYVDYKSIYNGLYPISHDAFEFKGESDKDFENKTNQVINTITRIIDRYVANGYDLNPIRERIKRIKAIKSKYEDFMAVIKSFEKTRAKIYPEIEKYANIEKDRRRQEEERRRAELEKIRQEEQRIKEQELERKRQEELEKQRKQMIKDKINKAFHEYCESIFQSPDGSNLKEQFFADLFEKNPSLHKDSMDL